MVRRMPDQQEYVPDFDEPPPYWFERNAQVERNNAQALEQLGEDLQYEKDRRREERFLFVSIITVLVDGYLFATMAGWAGQVVIGVIQLFGLAVYARHCGVQEVDQFIDRFLSFSPLHNRKQKPDGTDN